MLLVVIAAPSKVCEIETEGVEGVGQDFQYIDCCTNDLRSNTIGWNAGDLIVLAFIDHVRSISTAKPG